MRVGIDLTALLPKGTGVDNYMKSLVHSLACLDLENEYFIFVNLEDRRLFDRSGRDGRVIAEPLPDNFRVFPLSLRPRPVRLLFQQVVQPAVLAACRVDVLHSPAFIMPLYRGGQRHFLTIHDLTSFSLPETHTPFRRSWSYKRAVTWSIGNADLIGVHSHSVREDILRLFSALPPERVRVIPPGIAESFSPKTASEVKPALDRLNVRWPYILHVGNVNPRKNLERLVESYRRLIAEIPEHLVLAGSLEYSYDELLRLVDEPDLRDRVHLLGYVSDEDLPLLYAGARLFVFPSLQEGFGFPPLEAMACGVPVLASFSSSLAENLAGAAELVPPDDVRGIASAIERLLREEDLRERCIAEGFARAARFRWDSFARQILDCYRELAHSHGAE